MNKRFSKIESFVQANGFIQNLAEEKVDIKLYIDSSDVLDMLQGLSGMMGQVKGLDKVKYNSNATLVHSLIYNNWLGPVHISVPHQEELTVHLSGERTGFDLLDDESLQEFWIHVVQQTLGLQASDFEKKLSTEEYIKLIAPKAEELYKANYLLIQIEWRQKFKHLTGNNNILLFERNEDDLVKMVKTDLFKKWHDGFKKIRPERSSKNNLTDAVAMSIFHERLNQHKKLKLPMPVFFDKKNLFTEVLKLTKTTHEFEIDYAYGKFSTFVDEEFLVYLALYKNKGKISSFLNADQLTNFDQYQQLSSLIAQKKEIKEFVKEYYGAINNFTQSRFLQICWVEGEVKIHELVAELINAYNQPLRSKESKQLLEKEVNEFIDAIKDRTERFAIFKEIYDTVSSSKDRILLLFNENLEYYKSTNYKFDILNALSLIRFSIKDAYAQSVNELAYKLLFNNFQSETYVITYVVDNVLSVLQKKQKESIVVSVLILWIIEQYPLIDRIFNMLEGKYPHFSEGFIHAASIAKTMRAAGNDKSRILEIVGGINNHEEWAFKNNYHTSIAASYVYFNLWLKTYNKNFLTLFKEPEACSNVEVNGFFEKAFKWIENALNLLPDAELDDKHDHYKRARYYYCLNSKIYIITMGFDNAGFFKLRDEINLLEALENDHPELWEYRYYDTLALYYTRRAMIAKQVNKNLEKFQRYRQIALERVENGLKYVFSVEDQKKFKQLKRKIEDLDWD